MDIRIECSDRRTSVNVHNLKPRLVDLTHDNNALYVLKNGGDDATTELGVFFYTTELVTLRRQIDEILEQQKARLLAAVEAMPVDLSAAPEADAT